ncbi:MAG: WecB/TagA/CpsF family glycosyltransferase, partial [Chloroflexota bacterium]
PDILLVAFGNPKQEKWIGMYGRELGVPVMIGIGGTLDFIAGNTKRAPEWMQRTGLEWSYRLIQEPRRLWKRYAVDLTNYGAFFVRQWWAMRRGQTPTAVLPDTDWVLVGGTAVLTVKGQLTVSNFGDFNVKTQEALSQTSHIIINLARADFLDSSAIGSLVGLAKQARDASGDVLLAAVPPTILQSLKLLRLDQFFVLVENVESGMTMPYSQPERLVETAPMPQAAGEPRAAPSANQEPVKVLATDWAVYRTPRRLDAITAPELADKSREWLASSPNIILDMSDTTLLASAGLAALAQINRAANEQQGALRVANCSDDVMRVMQMVRFDKVLSLYSDVDAALE